MDDKKENVFSRLLEHIDRKNLDISYYPGISEKGYDDIPMLTANWNNPNLEKIYHWGESFFKTCSIVPYVQEIQFDWDDEWTRCDHCYKAIRTSPDCYTWTPSYMWVSDYEILCRNCYKEFIDELIEYNQNSFRPIYRDFLPMLTEKGFICYSSDEYCQIFHTGLREGSNDDPKKIFQQIQEDLPGYEIMFHINSMEQFDYRWSVYLRKKNPENERIK